MSESIEAINYKGYTIQIKEDNDPEDPRSWDNLGHMLCFHRRYELGDKNDIKYSHFGGWNDVKNYLVNELGAVIVLPIYFYDHSGMTISVNRTGQFTDRWDAGQVGFIYTSRKEILENWSAKHLTKKLREEAVNCLVAEVETYDQYLTGDVYGYKILDADSNEMESCWGFFGKDYCIKEAKSMVDWYAKDAEEKAWLELQEKELSLSC